jgi:hypothetical protein
VTFSTNRRDVLCRNLIGKSKDKGMGELYAQMGVKGKLVHVVG